MSLHNVVSPCSYKTQCQPLSPVSSVADNAHRHNYQLQQTELDQYTNSFQTVFETDASFLIPSVVA